MTEQPRTYLCFDFGLKRFGVAIGNDLLKRGRELPPIKAKDGIPDWSVIEHLVSDWKVSAFVVGLPLNMDGSESDMSVRAKKFGQRLKGRFNKAVTMMDERLSSYEAKSQAIEQGGFRDFGTYSVDGAAACLILESWFSLQHHTQAHNTGLTDNTRLNDQARPQDSTRQDNTRQDTQDA